MRSRIGILVGIVLALPFVVNPAPVDAWGPRKVRADVKALLEAPTFADAGEYTGALEGVITVNGMSYRLAPNVRIYGIGLGMMPKGTFVGDRMVSLSGITLGGTKIVQMVMVRPSAEGVVNAPIRAVEIADAGPR